MLKIALLGSTGSIGQQTIDLALKAPELYQIRALAAYGNNPLALAEQAKALKVKTLSVQTEKAAKELREILGSNYDLRSGTEGLLSLIDEPDINTVVLGVVGWAGIEPTLASLKAGKKLITANKEALAAGGALLKGLITAQNLIPADSEQVALHQCLHEQDKSKVKRVLLTASGGPFWNRTDDLSKVSVEEALKHPTWKMGPKVSIDSATMLNKGIEILETQTLFGLEASQIEAVIHPQSLVHSMVEYIDGNILAQLGANDMRLALQYALDYPERKQNLSGKFLDFGAKTELTFLPPDLKRFPCLSLAMQVAKQGLSYPATLIAAGEVAVEAFLAGHLVFTDIAQIVARALVEHKAVAVESCESLLEICAQVRADTLQGLQKAH